MKRLKLLLTLSCLLTASLAHAEIQKGVPQSWPGKLMIGARPLGTQINYTDTGFGNMGQFAGVGGRIIYKLGLDVAGIIANANKVTIWLGGEVNVGGRGNLAMIEPGIFVRLTLEKLILKMPLVPMIDIGVSGPLFIPYGYNGAVVFGGFNVKLGAGIYYFLTKNVGLGVDTHFGFGPGFVKVGNALDVGFTGGWDFLFGARFAL